MALAIHSIPRKPSRPYSEITRCFGDSHLITTPSIEYGMTIALEQGVHELSSRSRGIDDTELELENDIIRR